MLTVCCTSMEPLNIGILTEKWVCKICDADLEPTDKIGIFNVKKVVSQKNDIKFTYDGSETEYPEYSHYIW